MGVDTRSVYALWKDERWEKKSMSNRIVGANSDIIRPHIIELLSDGQPHSIREIRNYVMEMTGGIGSGGERITTSMIGSTMYNLTMNEGEYSHLKRGWYKKETGVAEVILENEREKLYNQAQAIIERTIISLNQTFSIDYLTTELSVKEIMSVSNVGKEIGRLLTRANEIIEQQLEEISLEQEDIENEETMQLGM